VSPPPDDLVDRNERVDSRSVARERDRAAADRAGASGRRIAGAIYVVLGVYVIGAGFVSAIPQIFWPAEAYGIAPIESADCGIELATLHDDLLADAAQRVGAADGSSADPFLEPWDERYRALERSCGSHDAYPLLARLRYRVEEHLLLLLADEAALSAATLSAIETEQ
jgi:hypothetical protein